MQKWGGHDGYVRVYNTGQDGFTFVDEIKGFDALADEFEMASAIVMEVNSTTFDSEAIVNAASNQREYDADKTAEQVFSNLGIKDWARCMILSYFPIVSNFVLQCQAIRNTNNRIGFAQDEEELAVSADKESVEEKRNALDQVLRTIRNEYDGKIILLYHPQMNIGNDGEIVLSGGDNLELFEECCGKNSIEFLNMTEDFVSEYEENLTFPYGFMNSTMGGHLNKTGHRLIAERLYKELEN